MKSPISYQQPTGLRGRKINMYLLQQCINGKDKAMELVELLSTCEGCGYFSSAEH